MVSTDETVPPPGPSTPPAQNTSLQTNLQSIEKIGHVSPTPISGSMTPPPSTQPARFHSPTADVAPDSISPTVTDRLSNTKITVPAALPTPDTIANASLEELRKIAYDLISVVKDARMTAAHFKLQHNLLSMETHEAAQRAEVEQQMTRREVEVLQAADQRHRTIKPGTPHQVSASLPNQSQVDALMKTCKELEEERDEAERRLQQSRHLIEREKDKWDLLLEENILLKRRIRENREHFSRLKSQSPMYTTPRDAFTTPSRKSAARFTDSTPSHAPFAALLAADQVLNGESLSVPSTPTKVNMPRISPHARNIHSTTSIHATPISGRPLTSDGYTRTQASYSAPLIQGVLEAAEQDRHDRDSTISMSDAEDGGSDDGVLQSQASSLATDMLRRNPASQESLRLSQGAERSSNLLQSRLFGTIKRSGAEKQSSKKRRGSYGDIDIKVKKTKMKDGVGLGIETWVQNE